MALKVLLTIRQVKGFESVPIIALTAGNVKDEKERCFKAGMNDFVSKPVSETVLREVLINWLPRERLKTTETVNKESHFDPNVLKRRLRGNMNTFEKILNIAKQQLLECSELLRRSYHENDLLELKRLSHKLYGTAISAGMPNLAKLSRSIENALDIPEASEALNKALEEIKLCIPLLKIS